MDHDGIKRCVKEERPSSLGCDGTGRYGDTLAFRVRRFAEASGISRLMSVTRGAEVGKFRQIGVMALLAVANAGADDALNDRFGLVHSTPEFCHELGTAWSRFDFAWSGIEREEGEFDFSELSAQVDRYVEQGVKILPILDYNPAWNPEVSPADPETLVLWSRYVARTVRQFGDRLEYWQVWNEPNIGFWKPRPDARAYAELLKISYAAAKSVNPNVKVLGFNCSDIDLKFTEEVIRYGGLSYCDVIAFQPYRIAPEVGHLEDMKKLRALLDRHGASNKPIWFTEMGWASEHFPFSDAASLSAERPGRRQAAFLVRYMTLITAAGVEKAFWFAQSAGSHGLVDEAGRKRPAFYAYKHFIDTAGDFEEVREITAPGANGIYAYLFRCPDRVIGIAWSAAGTSPLQIPGLSHARELRDMLGNTISRDGRKEFIVSEEPTYFIFDAAPDRLAAAASLRVSDGRIWLAPGESRDLTLRWVPFGGMNVGPVTCRLKSDGYIQISSSKVQLPMAVETVVRIHADENAGPSSRILTVSTEGIEKQIEIAITPKTLWSYQGASAGYLTPAVMRDLSGQPLILAGSFDAGEVVCLNAQGQEMWRYTDEAPVHGTPSIGNVHPDPGTEVVIALPKLNVIAVLSETGQLLWRLQWSGPIPADSPQWHWTQPAVADFDGDGLCDIVYADANGMVRRIGGDRREHWVRSVSTAPCDLPVCVADVLGDAALEILVADRRGSLRILSPDGEILRRDVLDDKLTTGAMYGSFRPGGPPFAFVGTGSEQLVAVPPRVFENGRLILGGLMDLGTGVELVDLTGDGENELIATTRNHEVRAYSASGEQIGHARLGAQVRSKPVAGDVDGDGRADLLVGSADHLLYCIGDQDWTYDAGDRIDGAPALVDLNGDGALEIVLPVRGGRIVALSTG